MIFRFNVAQLHSFELKINPNVNFSNYKYIIFKEPNSQKEVFNFYKRELQQGEPITALNTGYVVIKLTGFYNTYPKRPSWNKFKDFCPAIIYSYEIKDNEVLLTPENINNTNKIINTAGNKILYL